MIRLPPSLRSALRRSRRLADLRRTVPNRSLFFPYEKQALVKSKSERMKRGGPFDYFLHGLSKRFLPEMAKRSRVGRWQSHGERERETRSGFRLEGVSALVLARDYGRARAGAST